MCRMHAYKRDSHLVNQPSKRVPKRRKASRNFSSAKITEREKMKEKRRQSRENKRAEEHKEKIVTEIYLAKERKRQNITMYRRNRCVPEAQSVTKSVNMNILTKRKARGRFRRKMRTTKKMIYFLARISHSNICLFIILLTKYMHSDVEHTQTT